MKDRLSAINWPEVRRRIEDATASLRGERAHLDVAAIFRERTETLAHRPAEARRDEEVQVLVCQTGSRRYALPLVELAAVEAFQTCSPLPGASAIICGTLLIRNQMRVVADLARLMQATSPGQPSGGYAIAIRGRPLALRVDHALEVRPFVPANAASAALAEAQRALSAGVADDLTILVNLDAVWSITAGET